MQLILRCYSLRGRAVSQGTDALEMLEGRQYPLKLGYVGVVNRSQKAIKDGTPMRVNALNLVEIDD